MNVNVNREAQTRYLVIGQWHCFTRVHETRRSARKSARAARFAVYPFTVPK
jgi:hypothetical protein